MKVSLFFELIQASIGLRSDFSANISEQEGRKLYREAIRQSITGVTFIGFEKWWHQSEDELPSWAYQWAGVQAACERNYAFQQQQLPKVVALLEKEGLPYCLLKGLGVAALYPRPELRHGGDFDLWIDAPRKDIVEFAKKYGQVGDMLYHHVDAGKIEGVEVELHFTPSWMNNMVANHRMQRWFEECKSTNITTLDINGISINVPTMEFNRIYLLNHIYRHLFNEGIGMRQIMDYYFILRQGCTDGEKTECRKLLRDFNMTDFARAVMWVMQRVFGLDSAFMLVEPHEERGRFLLKEIMLSGNFGKFDKRNTYNKNAPLWKRTSVRLSHDFRFFSQYPTETMWSPIWKTWQTLKK